jgi:hypothetical protein
MVRRHLGKEAIKDPVRPRVAFARNFDQLRESVGSGATLADLDHYLLIARQCREWRNKGIKAGIGLEMKGIFKGGGKDLGRLLPGGVAQVRGPTLAFPADAHEAAASHARIAE